MFHLIYGSDRVKAQKRYSELLDTLRAEDPTRQIIEFHADTFVRSDLEDLVLAQSLFGSPALIFGDALLEREESRLCIGEMAGALAASAQTFVFLEEGLLAEDIKKILPHAKAEEFKRAALGREDERPLYALGDALGKKDKKEIWVMYQRSLLAGFPEEKVFWMLARQLKNMLLVKCGATMDDLGTKSDFVYKKTVTSAKNFAEKELAKRHGELVAILHDSHRGLLDFDIALERWLLSI